MHQVGQTLLWKLPVPAPAAAAAAEYIMHDNPAELTAALAQAMKLKSVYIKHWPHQRRSSAQIRHMTKPWRLKHLTPETVSFQSETDVHAARGAERNHPAFHYECLNCYGCIWLHIRRMSTVCSLCSQGAVQGVICCAVLVLTVHPDVISVHYCVYCVTLAF